MIGSFGDLVFVASADKIRTFEDFERTTSPRWALHDVHLMRPIPEYLGPGQDSISFSMYFDVRYGMRPRNELARLTRLCREGTVDRLIIGGMPMGTGKWYIESLGQTWEKIDNKGAVLVGRAEVTMKEYL